MGDLQQPILATFLIGLAGFTAWLLKDYIGYLKAQVSALTTQLGESTKAIDNLTDKVVDGFRNRDR